MDTRILVNNNAARKPGDNAYCVRCLTTVARNLVHNATRKPGDNALRVCCLITVVRTTPPSVLREKLLYYFQRIYQLQ